MPVKISSRPVNPQALREEATALGKEIEASAKAKEAQAGQKTAPLDKIESAPRVDGDVQAKAAQLQSVLSELSKVFLPSMMQSVMKGLPAAALQALESVKGPIGPLPQAIRDVSRRLHDFEAKFRTEVDAFFLEQGAVQLDGGMDRLRGMLQYDTADGYLKSRQEAHEQLAAQRSQDRGLWERLTKEPERAPFDREGVRAEIASVQDQVRSANAKLKEKYPHLLEAMFLPVPFDDAQTPRPRRPEMRELMTAARQAHPEYVALKKEQAELMGLFREEHGFSAENLVKAREKQLDPARALETIHKEALAIVNSLDAMAESNGPAKETLTTTSKSVSGSTSTSTRYLGHAPNDEGKLGLQTGQTVSSSSGWSRSTTTSEALLGEGRHFSFAFLPRAEEETSLVGQRLKSNTPLQFSRPRLAGPRTLYPDEAPVLADKMVTLLRLLEEAQYKFPGMPETRDLQNWVANTTFDAATVRGDRSSEKDSYTLARFRDELCHGRPGFSPAFVRDADKAALADEINAPLNR